MEFTQEQLDQAEVLIEKAGQQEFDYSTYTQEDVRRERNKLAEMGMELTLEEVDQCFNLLAHAQAIYRDNED